MEQDSMTSGWYFAKAGAPAGSETGPFEWEQLYQLANNGTVQPDDLVWNPKLPRGVAARLVPGLFVGLESSQTPVQQVWMDQAPEALSTEPQTPPGTATAPAAQPPQPAEALAMTPVTTPLDVEQSQPAVEEAPIVAQPAETAVSEDLGGLASREESAEEPTPQPDKHRQKTKSDRESNRLPLLVVLLTFIIAAAGVASYFLYFRV